jgi:hypothetical protein
LVRTGKTTWDELVDLRLAKKSRAKARNPLAVAFEAAKAAQAKKRSRYSNR